jgi:hypothetical protein
MVRAVSISHVHRCVLSVFVRKLQIFVRCGKEGNRTNHTAGYIVKVPREGPFEAFLGIMVIVKTAHSVVECEHHPSGITQRNAPAEDSTTEEYSLRCQGSFEMCNDLFFFGKAAWQAVEHVVKTDTFKGVAYCGEGQKKIVPDTVRFIPLEPASSP